MVDRTIIGVLMAATAMVAVAAVIPEPRKAAPLPTAGQPAASGAGAEGSAARIEAELERYRSMMDAGDPFANPGYLNVDRGETLWSQPAGQKNADLSMCDLGKGPGVVIGAYAELPRYFEDAGRVLDLEGRLLWCMVHLQGRSAAEMIKNRFSTPERTSDLEDLAAFVASKSNGKKLAPPQTDPREVAAYRLGEALFFRRQGPYDMACASCHGEPGRRIRLQPLPYFDDPAQARAVMATWPAYRVSQNALRTMQHRLYDCYWQMRLPQVDYTSDVTIALTAYLAGKGAGAVIQAPSIKR